MTVAALDHVNIVTADLDGTARFYVELLGLERRNGPASLPPDRFQWLYDDAGRAILHIRTIPGEDRSGPTGAIDHVALRCTGYEAVRARLAERGLEHRTGGLPEIGLRQIFVRDPNGVLLELNFPGH